MFLVYISDENITNMNSMNCVGLLIDAIQEHMVEPKLVKNACITLAAMVEADGKKNIGATSYTTWDIFSALIIFFGAWPQCFNGRVGSAFVFG